MSDPRLAKLHAVQDQKDPLYVAGEVPDTAFMAFYSGEWRELLEKVRIPGMRHDGCSGPTWDRKAAYLLWLYGNEHEGDSWADGWREVLSPDYGKPPVGTLAPWQEEPLTPLPYYVSNAVDNGVPYAFNSEGITPWHRDQKPS